jgi:hypothetical protein
MLSVNDTAPKSITTGNEQGSSQTGSDYISSSIIGISKIKKAMRVSSASTALMYEMATLTDES